MMGNKKSLDRLLLTSAALVAWTGTAFAQDAPALDEQGQPAGERAVSEEEDVILVTGTRIRRPNIDSVVPITSLDAEDILSTGNVLVGEFLEKLPMTRSTVTQQNTKDSIGFAGLNILDLRGLGTERTLVLQNGRRHVSARPGISVVDVNTIPAALIDRIDIVTGGSSAIYGSDAIAGVVNFILKRDFEGIEARGQSGISSRGDRGSHRVSLTAGKNFADGRGNIAASAEYARADRVEMTDRPGLVGSYAGYSAFGFIDNLIGEPGGTDGTPDTTFFRNALRILTYDANGVFIAGPSAIANSKSCSSVANACLANGFPRAFRFNSDGTLVEAKYGLDLRGLNNGFSQAVAYGDTGDTKTSTGQFLPGIERYAFNLLGRFELATALQPYFEAKYVRNDFAGERNTPVIFSEGSQSPTSTGAFINSFDGVPIRFDNPYLHPSAEPLIRSLLPAGATFFRLNRLNSDFASRRDEGKRETYRVVAGVQGDFNEDWHYDLSFNYGLTKQRSLVTGEFMRQRLALAADAVRDPTTGQIICRSQLPGQVTTSPTGNAADRQALAADIQACVPINLFGSGTPSQAARDYIAAEFDIRTRQNQKVVSGYVAGDSSQLLELPGGPIGFAVGAEWRQEDGFEDWGELARSGRTSIFNGAPLFDPEEKFEVKEVFGELNVPLLANRRLFHELTFSGAARLADYKGGAGTVLAWNLGGTWAPVPDMRLRSNYSVSVRAPSQNDLYRAMGRQNPVLLDPCDPFSINTNPNFATNCAAAGMPANFAQEGRGSSVPVSSGGNPLLKEETSKSWTIGAVFQPRFIPGFSLTADYFDITIEDALGVTNAQTTLNLCYGLPDTDNNFCRNVRRDPQTFQLATDAPLYAVLTGSVNFQRLTTRGIDFQAAYRTDIAELGLVNLRLIGTYLFERNDYRSVTNPDLPDQILLETGTPRFQANFNLDLKRGPFTFGYEARYLGKQSLGAIENIRPVGPNPPLNPDSADVEFMPDVLYHDFRLGVEVNKNYDFYVGIDNAFDQQPPFGRYGFNLDLSAAIFDSIGRYFYAGAVVKF